MKTHLTDREEKYVTGIMTWYAESAMRFTQLSSAALALPFVLAEKLHGAPDLIRHPHLKWVLLASWFAFLVAVGAGAAYQYLAVKYVEREVEGEDNVYVAPFLKRLAAEPGNVYGLMLVSFTLGAIFLFVYAASVVTAA